MMYQRGAGRVGRWRSHAHFSSRGGEVLVAVLTLHGETLDTDPVLVSGGTTRCGAR